MSGEINRLGILAGEGDLPLALVDFCIAHAIPVCVVQFKGCVYTPFPDVPILKTPIEKVGAVFRFFKQHNVTDVVMIGNLSRPDISALRPDWQGVKTLTRIASAMISKGDNALLTTLRQDIEAHGFHVKGIDAYIPDLTAPVGCLTQMGCDDVHIIKTGIKAALKHGAEDKGQCVLVHADGTIDYETYAGTSALIGAHGKKNSILVKMMKPNQDPDLDRPTVGVQTLEKLKLKQCRGLVVQADAVFLVHKSDMVNYANAHKLFIKSVAIDA